MNSDESSGPLAVWCPLCGTAHGTGVACPRQLGATGPETIAWRVAVETPRGARGYGVLLAEAGRRWRARIVTFPNTLWMVPGGGETIKFLAKRKDDALRQAIDFARSHCVDRGYLMRDELQCLDAPHRRTAARDGSALPPRAPRYQRRLPVRFGRSRPTLLGTTENLSETGLFVVTSMPLAEGELLGLSLELEHCKVPLRAEVAWSRGTRQPGRATGMGLALVEPPPVYVDYVRCLA